MFTRGYISVEGVELGARTELVGKSLVLDTESLRDAVLAYDKKIEQCTVAVTRPGDSTRIFCVKDVIQPYCKVEGDSPGCGKKHVLENVAVVTCGRIVGFQEGIIDMSGAGAPYTPFSATINIVLELTVVSGLRPHQHEEVVRKAGLVAADVIGEVTRRVHPERLLSSGEENNGTAVSGLPRVVYIYMLLSQGLLHDTYVLGRNARDGLPCIVNPSLLLDDVIVSGNCVSACDKNTTWHHQNNPVLLELLRRHGKELHFAGVVLTNEPVRLADKENSATETIALVRGLQADGVILSKEGFGNPDADQMLLTRGLEQSGVRVVAITDEFAGPEGSSQSLADTTMEADAIVSVGNANERILLPPMERVLGPVDEVGRLAGAWPYSLHEDGSLEVELQAIIGATNELGMQTLSCREV